MRWDASTKRPGCQLELCTSGHHTKVGFGEQERRDYDTSIISDFPRRLADAHYS